MTSILTRVISKLLLLPTLVAAVALLVKGYVQPGDGFSAGVVAGLAVLMQYLAFGHEEAEKLPVVKFAGVVAFVGLLISLSVAVVPVFLGDPVLTHYPPPEAHVYIFGTLEILTAVLFDVGVFLLVFGFAVGTTSIFARAISEEEEYGLEEASDDPALESRPGGGEG
ncbi:MAG: MnhB domain-containing protein [Actinomycetota bacterium]|nr:MnhB domain-containing protein [Actinomycetota bacterium]